MSKHGGQLYVERRPQKDYAVRRPGSERASDVLPTQREAIERVERPTSAIPTSGDPPDPVRSMRFVLREGGRLMEPSRLV
jgi:hypothetical protein